MTLQSHFLRAASEEGAGISFIRSGNIEERVTYSQLYAKALKVLGGLTQKGLRPRDELVIQVQDNKELLLLFWGCILGGIIPVPLSPGIQLQQKTKLSQIWKYLSHPHLADDDLLRYVLEFSDPGVVVPASETDIAYIQFSSGSTGEPKGVILTHGNLDANINDITTSLEIGKDDRLLSWMPLTHDMGMIGFHLTGVANGIEAISIDTQLFIRRPMVWMEKSDEHRASVLYSPNFGFQYFLSSHQQKGSPSWHLSCIRIIVNGAESISARLCDEFSNALQKYGLKATAIVTAYGLAEACVEVSAMPVNTPIRSHWVNRDLLNIGDVVQPVAQGSVKAVNFVDVGRPVPSCSVRICDGADIPLPGSTLGHIQLAGKNITPGYYNNSAATRSAFTEDGWLRTGDVGYIFEGRLVITGRLKNIIIVNGRNFYPNDIERAIIDAGISELGKVAACGVQRPDEDHREELVLFFIYKGDNEHLAAQSRRIASAVWNTVGVQVDKVVPIRKMPKTTSGKIQYFQLAESYQKGELPAIQVLHEPTDRGDIMDIVCSLLGCGDIPADTNLLTLGLNSLTAVQLCSRIRHYRSLDISVEDIFRTPTVSGLEQLLQTASFQILPVPVASREHSGIAPMSAAQQRIWLEMQLNRSSVAYNIPIAHRIKGGLDIPSLESAIRETIKRYEILRTSYCMGDDLPVQKIHLYDDRLFTLVSTDIHHAADPEKELRAIFDEEVDHVFDLGRPCQISGRVVRIEENLYCCILVFHHILTDGWSLASLMTEISELYRIIHNGLTVVDPAEDYIQYRDYVRWQQQIRDTPAYLESKSFWTKEIAGISSPATLSGKAPVSDPYRGYAAGHYSKVFTAQELATLNGLASEYGTTPFCIVMALLNILLYRYTGNRDVVVGFDTYGRITPEMEKIMGYLINTLCLRTNLHEGQTIADIICLIRDNILKAVGHQLFSFEDLMATQKPAHTALQNPFFDILVLYQNFYQSGSTLQLEGCTTSMEHIPVKEGLAGLVMEFSIRGDSLHLTMQYMKSRYGHGEIQQLAAHISNLLAEISGKQGSEKMIALNFLTEKEMLMPIAVIPCSNRQIPDQQPLHRLFRQQAGRHPERVAVVAGAKQLTYGELDSVTDRLSRTIRQRHQIVKDDKIGFLTSRNEHIVIAILTIWKSGAAYVPIDPEWPKDRRDLVIIESGIKCLITDDVYHAGLDKACPAGIINIDRVEDGPEDDYPEVDTAMTDLAYVIYTSGSTGKPKGVMIEHHTLVQYVAQFISYFAIAEKDVFIQQASVGFDTLVEEIFPALCTSGRIVIASQGGRDTEKLLSEIHRNKVTILTTTPLVLQEINAKSDARTDSLRTIISGGDVLSPACIDKLAKNTEIYNTYGPSETTVCACYKKVDDISESALIGKPIHGYRVYLLDDNMQLLPWGKTGHIYISGGCARGYLNEPELTRRNFIENPLDANSMLYRTGDLGRWTEYGDLEFVGRNDNQVKVRGHRVELEEVEKVIMEYKDISLTVVLQDQQRDYLVAFLLRSDPVFKMELHSYLAEKLPYYMVPYHYILVDEIPLTSSGKIDRNALRELLRGDAPAIQPAKSVAPQSKTETLLVDLWKNVLNIQNPGVTDNFFELGGQSVKATQLLNRIYMATGVEIQLAEIFMYPTIREQGELLAKREEKKYQFIDIL